MHDTGTGWTEVRVVNNIQYVIEIHRPPLQVNADLQGFQKPFLRSMTLIDFQIVK